MKGVPSIVFGSVLVLALIGCGDDLRIERRSVTYPNGKSVKEDWTFTRKPNGDTLEHGVHKKFFWNGNPSESVICKMGKKDGSAQAWYENGASKWQKSYDNGAKQGTWRLSYMDGKPWIVTNYVKDQLNGQVQVWGKDGGDPKTAEFANGVCKSGECALLDAPVIAEDAPAAEKIEATRSWDIIKDFLN